MSTDLPAAILFFDSDCLLCDRSVAWMSRRDPQGRLWFAPLTGETAAGLLGDEAPVVAGGRPASVIFARRLDSGRWRFTTRSDAIIDALQVTAGAPVRRHLLALLPKLLRDAGYDLVAQIRYAVFGRVTECSMRDRIECGRVLP